MRLPGFMAVVLACALVASLASAQARSADVARAVPAVQTSVPFSRGVLFRLDKPGVAPSFVFGTVHSSDPRVTTLPRRCAMR
jgi:uncharacterized protein YbaP (TraB family)